MKTKLSIVVLTATVLMLCTGIAKAETLFSCDFENYISSPSTPYTVGNIVGQDNWAVTPLTGWPDAYVGNGIGVNTSKVFTGNPVEGNPTTSDALRLHASPLTFSTDGPIVELGFWGNAEHGPDDFDMGSLSVSMMWEGAFKSHFGAVGMYYKHWTNLKPQAYFRTANSAGTMTYGDELDPGHWYEVKAEMDFSQKCSDNVTYGKITYYYKDLTDNDTEFTKDGTIVDLDMFVPLNGTGKIQSNGIFAYTQAYDEFSQHQYIDNITISQVPEPSTLALLATGLLGLLAYAWRKRK